jgi:hypothetical protein
MLGELVEKRSHVCARFDASSCSTARKRERISRFSSKQKYSEKEETGNKISSYEIWEAFGHPPPERLFAALQELI